LCRVVFLFPGQGLEVIAWVGAFTALLAAVIAVQQNDIKRILAYSTLSQLGYMVLAVAVSPTAAMFHLVTHAFFKALLFLGAGSVIYALHHEQNIRRMGGLRGQMPITYWTFLIATLALCGVPPFSGFFSKDAIMAAAAHHGVGLFIVTSVVAVLTTFYMFRLFFVAFAGSARVEEAAHARESPKVMTWPLILLAIPSVLAGVWGINLYLGRFFSETDEATGLLERLLAPFGHSPLAASASLIATVFGFSLAYTVYRRAATDPIPERLGILARAMRKKFYFDEVYAFLIRATHESLARLANFLDRHLIEGLGVRGVSGTTDVFGRALRLLQTGNLQTYTFLFAAGVAIVLLMVLYH